jgi:hypothetical protein
MVEWAQRNIGAGVAKVDRWDAGAGFPSGTAWCGIFLGSGLKAMGLKPPSGYAAASSWASYGTPVSEKDLRPGDIIDYGSTHVAMYIGGGKQIQGNDGNGTVGVSGIGPSLGLGPITAIRRPPYKSGGSAPDRRPRNRNPGDLSCRPFSRRKRAGLLGGCERSRRTSRSGSRSRRERRG